ncbi:MAG: J domain-containing protein [Thermodesulfobacteriota bacterium]
MKNKNPFEILGITPAIVRSLAGKELFSLVKASYRALLLIYHPDRSPLHDQELKRQRNSKMAEINLAFEKLDLDRDPASLEHYRDLYARRAGEGWRKTIRRLNREILDLNADKEYLSQGYLRRLLDPGFFETGTSGAANVYNLRNLRLGLQDIAINHNVKSLTWELGTNYKEIKFDAEGRMFYKLPCRKKAIPVNFINLLGTVDKDKVDLIPLLDRVIPNDQISSRERWKNGDLENLHVFDVLNRLSIEKFRLQCLPFLKPEITEGSFLFSLHKNTLREKRIEVEGLVIRTHDLTT